MQVYADNMLHARMLFPLRMHEAVAPSRSNRAFVGFCGSTGDAISSLQITSFRFAALEQAGSTYAFGDGVFGQLGLDDREARVEPNLITTLDGISVSSVATGMRHTAALAEDGKVYTWGSNDLGQLGHADTRDRLTPTVVRRIYDLQSHLTRKGLTFQPVAIAAGDIYL
jgi:hypothetical protein